MRKKITDVFYLYYNSEDDSKKKVKDNEANCLGPGDETLSKGINSGNYSLLTVSTTKFSIVIGSLHAYLLHNYISRSHGYPISTFCNWVAVAGHLHCVYVNLVH